jgi:hypothetical protein
VKSDDHEITLSSGRKFYMKNIRSHLINALMCVLLCGLFVAMALWGVKELSMSHPPGDHMGEGSQ